MKNQTSILFPVNLLSFMLWVFGLVKNVIGFVKKNRCCWKRLSNLSRNPQNEFWLFGQNSWLLRRHRCSLSGNIMHLSLNLLTSFKYFYFKIYRYGIIAVRKAWWIPSFVQMVPFTLKREEYASGIMTLIVRKPTNSSISTKICISFLKQLNLLHEVLWKSNS
jgi:hypothetical protein